MGDRSDNNGNGRPHRRRAIAKGTAWAAIDNWTQQVFQLVTFLIIGNILGPDIYGTMVIALLYVLFIQAFLVEGFSQSIVQRAEIEREHVEAAFWSLTGLGLIAVALSFPAAGLVASVFSKPVLVEVIRWLSISFLFAGASSVLQSRLRRDLNFRALALRSVVAYGSAAAVGITLAVMGYGIWSLVVYHLWLSILDFLMLNLLTRWLPRPRFSQRHFGDLFHFGAHITAARIVNFFNSQIDRLLVGYVLGTTALGHFGMARRVVDGATFGLAGVMNTVALSVLSRLQDDRERLVQAFRSATHFISLIIFPAFAGLALVAPILVDAFLRPEWRPMGGVLQILSLGAMVVSLNWVLGAIIRATGRADLSFRISVFSTVLKIVLCVLAVPFGIEAVAVAFVIVPLSVHPIMLYFVRKIIGVRFQEIAAELAPAAVSTVIMSTCVAAAHMVLTGHLSNGAELGALVAVGVVTYGAALFVTARRSLVQLVHGFPR